MAKDSKKKALDKKSGKRVVMSGVMSGKDNRAALNELKRFAKERGSVEAAHRRGDFKFKKESLGN